MHFRGSDRGCADAMDVVLMGAHPCGPDGTIMAPSVHLEAAWESAGSHKLWPVVVRGRAVLAG